MVEDWNRLPRVDVSGRPDQWLKLVSAYFVPGSEQVDCFIALARSGVEVAVLTNALEATDVPAVHAGYAKRRKPLLEAGVSLFEMNRSSADLPAPRVRSPSGGSSGTSLHAKTFSMDGVRIFFIGSFNFDPRSARLNTELGFVIDSPTLAQAIGDTFSSRMPAQACQVRLSADGSLRWIEQVAGREVVHEVEPGSRFWTRPGVSLLSTLPIEWLL